MEWEEVSFSHKLPFIQCYFWTPWSMSPLPLVLDFYKHTLPYLVLPKPRLSFISIIMTHCTKTADFNQRPIVTDSVVNYKHHFGSRASHLCRVSFNSVYRVSVESLSDLLLQFLTQPAVVHCVVLKTTLNRSEVCFYPCCRLNCTWDWTRVTFAVCVHLWPCMY